jgi:Zn-dependent protease
VVVASYIERMDSIIPFVYFLVALLITLTVHEAAHATAAYYLGDPTAKIRGRMSLNPIRHLDPIGSLVFLLTQSIGWGKPVPVNPNNFRHAVRDEALTSLAGPLSNFLLAFVAALPLKYLSGILPNYVMLEFWMIFHASIYLGIFNLFPFPPLDGSKIIGLFIPKSLHRGYENFLRNGVKYFIAIILIDVFILGRIFDSSILGYLMQNAHDFVSAVLLLGT